MAQANIYIICSECGKEFRHTKICYNRDAANNYEEWAKENIITCPSCYAEQQKRIKEEQNAENVKEVRENYNLPELKGTEKQVKWANEIRANAIKSQTRMLEKLIAQKQPTDAEVKQAKKMIEDAASIEVAAKWWIENRDFPGTAMMRAYRRKKIHAE